MASSPTLFTCFLVLFFSLKLSSCLVADSSEGYANILPLPTFNSTLYYTYNKPKSTLSVLFRALPPSLDGWVAWGINPNNFGMVGAEVIAGFKEHKVMVTKTLYFKSRTEILSQKLSFDVWSVKAEQNSDGFISIYAIVKVPEHADALNHTWQVGASVKDGMIVQPAQPNFNNNGRINLTDETGFCPIISTMDAMVHATPSLLGFGILFPIGILIPRYLDLFLSDPESLPWFYVYACCQLFGFCFGVTGWAKGIRIGRASGFSVHGIIGTVLVCFGTIQIIILFKNTNKMKHKDRLFRNIYYYTVGYLIIFLGIFNNSMGIRIKNSEQSWESYYEYWLIGLNGIIVCEIFIRAHCCCLGRLARFNRP